MAGLSTDQSPDVASPRGTGFLTTWRPRLVVLLASYMVLQGSKC